MSASIHVGRGPCWGSVPREQSLTSGFLHSRPGQSGLTAMIRDLMLNTAGDFCPLKVENGTKAKRRGTELLPDAPALNLGSFLNAGAGLSLGAVPHLTPRGGSGAPGGRGGVLSRAVGAAWGSGGRFPEGGWGGVGWGPRAGWEMGSGPSAKPGGQSRLMGVRSSAGGGWMRRTAGGIKQHGGTAPTRCHPPPSPPSLCLAPDPRPLPLPALPPPSPPASPQRFSAPRAAGSGGAGRGAVGRGRRRRRRRRRRIQPRSAEAEQPSVAGAPRTSPAPPVPPLARIPPPTRGGCSRGEWRGGGGRGDTKGRAPLPSRPPPGAAAPRYDPDCCGAAPPPPPTPVLHPVVSLSIAIPPVLPPTPVLHPYIAILPPLPPAPPSLLPPSSIPRCTQYLLEVSGS